MTPERWREVRDVYERAARRAAPARAEFLATACGSDRELRREVESLLGCQARADDAFLETPAVALLERGAAQSRAAARVVGGFARRLANA
jgi:hypothetical protein